MYVAAFSFIIGVAVPVGTTTAPSGITNCDSEDDEIPTVTVVVEEPLFHTVTVNVKEPEEASAPSEL